jgi:hypothetical protein
MLDSAINKRTFSMVLWCCPALSGAGQLTPSLLMNLEFKLINDIASESLNEKLDN